MGTWGEGEEWGWGRGPSAEARGRGRQGGEWRVLVCRLDQLIPHQHKHTALHLPIPPPPPLIYTALSTLLSSLLSFTCLHLLPRALSYSPLFSLGRFPLQLSIPEASTMIVCILASA